MTITDDIFDVIATLEGTPEGEQFDAILNRLNSFERTLDEAYSYYERSFDYNDHDVVAPGWVIEAEECLGKIGAPISNHKIREGGMSEPAAAE